MPYTQSGRRLKVTTPLGPDVLILNGFSGHEAVSRPFLFQLECVAENVKAKQVVFDALLGQKITAEIALPGGAPRFVNGTCLRVAEGARDATFTHFRLDLVPEPFLLSRKTQSRIFQQASIPSILKEVLKDFDVSYEITGTFHPRDYCVQYRESDFAFVSRLMEEEGIYYFFKHSDGSHVMVVANTPGSHSDLPGKSALIYETVGGGSREEDRVQAWEKSQELRSGKVMLWDHSFELPHKHLEIEYPIEAAVPAGKASHKLKLGANAKLELYDYPGGYAQRFDGINKGGGEEPSEIQKIFKENLRTAEIRMQSEAAASVLVHATSNCRQVVSGHKFTLERHFDGDGPWVVYEVEHAASEAADLRSGGGGFTYQNRFTCFPVALPFRPPRVTPIPTVRGTQSAVVVGPPGEEIFTDKYGRIKVQFHWDREGAYDSDSSCWIRVVTPWAGHRWGAIHIPRIGQEVVVDFLEGDMDQPIVIGGLYNADCMPPYELPKYKTYSTMKSRSTRDGGNMDFNELRYIDTYGKEHVFLHAQRRMDVRVKKNKYECIGGTSSISVGGDQLHTIGGDYNLHAKGKWYLEVDSDIDAYAKGNIKLGTAADIRVGAVRIEANAKRMVLDGGSELIFRVGGNFVRIDGSGVTIQGTLTRINGGGGAPPAPVPDIDGPLDAGGCDTGEPGYLDRPYKGGGGGRKHWNAYNGSGLDIGGGKTSPVFRNDDGSVSVGNSITIKPSSKDPQFTDKVLDDLGAISSTPSGKARPGKIEDSGHTVNIERIDNGANAQEISSNNNDAAKAGAPAFGGGTGTGKGSDSTVQYNPDFKPPTVGPDPAHPLTPPGTVPSDDILFHELGHTEHGVQGQQDATALPTQPDGRQFDNKEEKATTDEENTYRDERGLPRRFDHHNL